MSSVPASMPPYNPKRRYTVEEYLALDASHDDERCEYIDGYVSPRRAGAAAERFEMIGASLNHPRILSNLLGTLRSRLAADCQAFVADLRVRTLNHTLYAYPDVFVVRRSVRFEEIDGVATVTNPLLIIEVLSRSTEHNDRGPKFTRYREIESLREYVLVSQFEQLVEPFYKTPQGIWAIGTPVGGAEASVRLNSLDIEIPLAEIYAGVLFADAAGAADEPDTHPSP